MTDELHETHGPVIRDRRRIDPETGQVREPRQSAAPAPADQPPSKPGDAVGGSPERSDVEITLAERTADLQRLQAEYVNYKRRVDRDRQATRETAVASVLTSLLPVLDDIGRAREHDELTGGFKAVAESFERTVSALGLVTFAEAGDVFDPRIHEALMHSYSDEVDGPVCQTVLQVGYRLGDRILRPARVSVAEPQPAGLAGLAEPDDTLDVVGDDAADLAAAPSDDDDGSDQADVMTTETNHDTHNDG